MSSGSDDKTNKKLELLLNKTKLFSHLKNKSKPNDNSQQSKNEDEPEENSEIFSFRTTPFYVKFAPMRNYQVEGLNWLISLYHNDINGILADEMGLGKTLQTISLVGYLKHFRNSPKYHLVICPKSTLSNWVAEFKRWVPTLHVEALQGNQEERSEFISNILRPGAFEVLVTTFELCIIESKWIKKFNYEYVIIDEAHRIKNENSRLSEVVRYFKSKHRLLLTGTPLQNNLHELWALLNFLLPDFFDSADDFDSWFQNENCLENERGVVEKLHAVLRPFLLRRLKKEVEKKLPDKKELKLYVGLTDMQREWYKGVLLKDLPTINGQSKESFRLNNVLMQLRKVCNHPYLFEGAEPQPYTTGDHLVKNCGKMVLLDKLLTRLYEQKDKVLLFSQMTHQLNIIEDYLIWRGYKYCRLDGNTSYAERQEYIADFTSPDSDKFIFILSTRAGGLGINLVAANVVVIYDSDWNPQMDLQAMDRAHRIGQTKAVKVFRLITEKTVEERIVERAEMKLKLDNIVIQQGRLIEQKSNKLSKDEMLAIVRHGAEEIIHSNVSMITDEDIDAILKRAEDKSAQDATNEKFNSLIGQIKEEKPEIVPEIKDMYTFEGLDYKQQKITAPHDYFNMDVIRKRERKIINYDLNEELFVKPNPIPKTPKLPKIHTVPDYQFYPQALLKLIEKEFNYAKKLANYKAPTMPEMTEEEVKGVKLENEKIENAEPLTDDEVAEQKELMSKGYNNWARKDFLNFIKANEKYGRDKINEISNSVPNKTPAEVMDYYNTFWTRFSELNDSQRYINQIERGEAKIKRHFMLIEALNDKIKQYDFPQYQMKLPSSAKMNKYFNEPEDRFMLYQLHKHGVDNPNIYSILQSEFRKSAEFRFDWFIKSRTQYELEKRANILLSSLEREYSEKQKINTNLNNNEKTNGGSHSQNSEPVITT